MAQQPSGGQRQGGETPQGGQPTGGEPRTDGGQGAGGEPPAGSGQGTGGRRTGGGEPTPAGGGGHAGRGYTGGHRPVDPATIVPLALAAALVVFAAETVLQMFQSSPLVRGPGASIDVVAILRDNIADVVSHVGIFGAVVALVATDGARRIVVRGAVVVYAMVLADSFVRIVLRSITTSATAQPSVGTFLGPLFQVFLFLGIAMTYRLYVGKTILPGVNYRA